METRDELKRIYKIGAGIDAGSPLKNPEYQALVSDIEQGESGELAMRITCPHCGELATIRSSKPLSKLAKEAMCQCKNMACGHIFVANIEVVRTILSPLFPDPLVDAELPKSTRWQGVHGAESPSNTQFFKEGDAMT